MGILDGIRAWRVRRRLAAAARRIGSADFADTLQASRNDLLKLLQGFNPAQMDWIPGPERLSVGQILDLLCRSESAMVKRAEALSREEKPPPFRPAIPARARPVEQVFADLARVRGETLAAARGLKWPVLSRDRAVHPDLGSLDAGQWLMLVWQEESRRAREIAEILASKDFPHAKA